MNRGPDDSPDDSTEMELTQDSPAPLQKPLSPGFHFGQRYKILERLGEGGMGIIYRAYDNELHREVALKLMKPSIGHDEVVIERFKREIALASRITHKNVLRIHDLGEVDGTRFVSMNYVKGQDLSKILKRARLSRERAVSFIKQFCVGLTAAHEEGVLHRDLKPQNVLIDENDNVFITDFGLARSVELKEDQKALTGTGMVVGTPMYMSPEQIKAEEFDKASDVYTFGLIAYEMLTGQFPFEMKKGYDSLFKRIHEKPKDPKAIDPTIPDYLATIVMKCLEPQLPLRYQDASEILHDLEARSVKLRPRILWRKQLLTTALFLIVFLATLWFLHQKKQAQGPTNVQTVLAVLPLQNASADKALQWMSTGVPDLIGEVLRETKTIRVVASNRLNQIQRSFPDEKIDSPTMLGRISEFCDADIVITGKLMKDTGGLRVIASVMDFRVSPAVTFSIEVQGNTGSIVESLSAQIKKHLGATPDEQALDFRKLISTKDAVFAPYYQGLMSFDQGEHLAWEQPTYDSREKKAIEQIENALHQDPTFALGHAKLAQIYYEMDKSEQATKSLQAAMKYSDALPQYDRLKMQLLQAKLDNDAAKTAKALEQLQSIYPNDSQVSAEAGSFFYEQGDWRRALQNFQIARKLDPKSVYILAALGATEWRNANPQNALKYYTEAQTLSGQLATNRERAELLIGQALAYKDVHYYESAVEHYQKALALAERIGSRSQVAKTLGNMGLLYAEMGKYQEAKQNYEQALAILQQLGDKAQTGRVLNNLGVLSQKFGHYDAALQYYTQGLEFARTWKYRFGITNGLINIGSIYHLQGRYTDAATNFQLGLEEIDDADRRLKAMLLFSKAILFKDQAKYANALDLFSGSLEIWRNTQAAVDFALTLIDSASVYNSLGLYGEANKRLAEAQKIADDVNDKEVFADLLIRRCEMLRLQQNFVAAETLAAKIQTAAEESKTVNLILAAQMEIGTVYNQMQQPDRSLPLLQKMLKESESMGLRPLTARAKAEVGRAYELQHKPTEALREIQSAIDLAGQLGIHETLIKSHFIAARIYETQNKPDQALNHYQQALSAVDEIRQDSAKYADSFMKRKDIQELLAQAADSFKAAGREKQFAPYAKWISANAKK